MITSVTQLHLSSPLTPAPHTQGPHIDGSEVFLLKSSEILL